MTKIDQFINMTKSDKMKKMIIMLAACLMVSLASCNSTADYDAISKKIEKEEQLTNDDYSAMVEYLEDAAEKESDYNWNDFENSYNQFEKDYPHFMTFAFAIGMADAEGKLDSSLKKRMKSLTQRVKPMQ